MIRQHEVFTAGLDRPTVIADVLSIPKYEGGELLFAYECGQGDSCHLGWGQHWVLRIRIPEKATA